MGNNISLTYEKLFDITRKEKNSEELQKLDKNFYIDFIEYLNDKANILFKEKEGSLFSKSEKELTAKQLENIKKLITELNMRREQKLMNLAIIKSRTNSNLIDTSALLDEEKILFNNMVSLLNEYKQKVLLKILSGQNPSKPTPINDPKLKSEIGMEKKHEKIEIEFINEVPKFIGKELEPYGPFEKGTSAILPEDVANILIKKGRAKKK